MRSGHGRCSGSEAGPYGAGRSGSFGGWRGSRANTACDLFAPGAYRGWHGEICYSLSPAPTSKRVSRFGSRRRARQGLPRQPHGRRWRGTGADREQVHAETVRGRQLGPAHIILVDLPWSCAQRFVRSHPLRGAQDRNVRLTALSLGGTGGRPSSGDALDAAARWVEQLDPDTAQEYFESAQEAVEGSVDGEPFEEEGAGEPLLERAPAPQPALPRRTARATPAQLQRLQGLAGLAPPRAGGVERAARLDQGTMADLRMESQLEALPPAEVEDPAQELASPDLSLQAMLLAQMRQNALLLERLVNKSGDGIQDALAGGASASDGSGGIKGHLARDAYVRQLSDSKTVATKVEANALTELGMTTSEPGLMRSYLEKRVPLGDLKTLQYLGTMAAYG